MPEYQVGLASCIVPLMQLWGREGDLKSQMTQDPPFLAGSSHKSLVPRPWVTANSGTMGLVLSLVLERSLHKFLSGVD